MQGAEKLSDQKEGVQKKPNVWSDEVKTKDFQHLILVSNIFILKLSKENVMDHIIWISLQPIWTIKQPIAILLKTQPSRFTGRKLCLMTNLFLVKWTIIA